MSHALREAPCLPAGPQARLITYFRKGKQSWERSRASLQGERNAMHATKLSRSTSANGAKKECLFRRQNRCPSGATKILCSARFEANPLCQEWASSINLRQLATIMMTIWRARASVLDTTWIVRDLLEISESCVEIGPGPSLGRK